MCIGLVLVGGGIIAQIKVPCIVAELRNSVALRTQSFILVKFKVHDNNCFLLRHLFRLFELFMTVLAYHFMKFYIGVIYAQTLMWFPYMRVQICGLG